MNDVILPFIDRGCLEMRKMSKYFCIPNERDLYMTDNFVEFIHVKIINYRTTLLYKML